MADEKMKICAPRQNPHICYVQRSYKKLIKEIRKKTGMTFYAILCECAGQSLSTTEEIKSFRSKLKERGFRNIGEWAEAVVQYLYDHLKGINDMDFSVVGKTIEKLEEEEDE